jgi:hypothetical protein
MATSQSVQSVWKDAFDGSTHALNTIDYAHHELHGGSLFSASGAVDLAAAGTLILTFRTPDTTKWAHMVPAVVSELETDVKLYEGFTAGTAHGGTIGDAVTAWNRNRNSATLPTCSVYTGATAGTASPGTIGTALLQTWHWGSGRDLGGSQRAENEWVAKQNTTYALQIVNAVSNAANFINWDIEWYEHTDKE